MSLYKPSWLNAVTSGTTAAENVEGLSHFSLQSSYTGGSASFAVVLEGSVDGLSWFELTRATPGQPLTTHHALTADQSQALTGVTVGLMPRLIRLNLSNPGASTITASLYAI